MANTDYLKILLNKLAIIEAKLQELPPPYKSAADYYPEAKKSNPNSTFVKEYEEYLSRNDIQETKENVTGKIVTKDLDKYLTSITTVINEDIPDTDIERYIERFPGSSSCYYGFRQKSTGSIICNAIYDSAYFFTEGLASVSLNDKWGFIDKTGKIIVPLIYDYALPFSDGLSIVDLNLKKGFINKVGEIIIPFIYDDICSFSDGLANVGLFGEKNSGYIDKSGKIIIPLIYDDTCPFSEGLGLVTLNGKNGFLDNTGKVIIPFIYDDATNFSDGLAIVKNNGKYGYIDKKGVVVIPLIYDTVSPFLDCLAMVQVNSKYGYIDQQGKIIKPLIYTLHELMSERPIIIQGYDDLYYTEKKGLYTLDELNDLYGDHYEDSYWNNTNKCYDPRINSRFLSDENDGLPF